MKIADELRATVNQQDAAQLKTPDENSNNSPNNQINSKDNNTPCNLQDIGVGPQLSHSEISTKDMKSQHNSKPCDVQHISVGPEVSHSQTLTNGMKSQDNNKPSHVQHIGVGPEVSHSETCRNGMKSQDNNKPCDVEHISVGPEVSHSETWRNGMKSQDNNMPSHIQHISVGPEVSYSQNSTSVNTNVMDCHAFRDVFQKKEVFDIAYERPGTRTIGVQLSNQFLMSTCAKTIERVVRKILRKDNKELLIDMVANGVQLSVYEHKDNRYGFFNKNTKEN